MWRIWAYFFTSSIFTELVILYYDSGQNRGRNLKNRQEIFAFADSGENAGQLRQMCAGTEVAEGEREFLRKLEKEAARYGFRVGEDLADTTERSAE